MNPIDVIAQSAKLNPEFTKYLIGIPAAAAAVALCLTLVKDPPTAIFGIIAVLVLVVIVFAISNISVSPEMTRSLIWFVRAVLLIFIIVVGLLVSCVFFSRPQPIQCLVRPFDPNCSRLAGEVDAPPAVPPSPPPSDSAALRRDYTVYVQFTGLARATVAGLASRLKSLGWKVPGTENIRTASDLNEVRYRTEKDKAAAEALVADMKQAQGFDHDTQVRQVGIITPGTLEVWISN